MFFRFSHEKKAKSLTDTIVFGKLTVSRLKLSLNAYLPIRVIPFDTVIDYMSITSAS